MGILYKTENNSNYRGSIRLARMIQDYWLARGRKLEPQVRAVRIVRNEGSKDMILWGLSSPPLLNGLPPPIKGTKPTRDGR